MVPIVGKFAVRNQPRIRQDQRVQFPLPHIRTRPVTVSPSSNFGLDQTTNYQTTNDARETR
jgi:hypothetical protein